MRCLNLNKRRIWYANYVGKTELLDENQNRTGQYSIEFTKPVSIRLNVSAARGDISTRQFGDDEAYDRVLVHDDPLFDINEHSILWIDIEPALDAHGALAKDTDGNDLTPHDYIVKSVARSLNSVSVAISKVSVSG